MDDYTSRPDPLLKLTIALIGGFLLSCIGLTAFAAGFQADYSGRILPGVSVAGIDVAGMSIEQAAFRLEQSITYPQQGRIAFRDGTTVWMATPAELGVGLDVQASAEAAFQVGRRGNPGLQVKQQVETWLYGVDLPPALVYDERVSHAYLTQLASVVDRPTVEATLGVNGAEVLVHSGQVGRTVDVQATQAALQAQVQSLGDGVLPLVVHETAPVILDVSEQAKIARQILAAPLVLVIPDAVETKANRWVLQPETLAGMLAIERVQSEDGGEIYQVGLSSEQLSLFLENIAPDLERTAANARFIFNDDTRQLEAIQPSVTGRTLLIQETVQAIQDNLANGKHRVEMAFEFVEPAAPDTATAADLGISELVSEQISYFYGSSSSRIQNIAVAAGQFHGILIAPGETFSMASVLGDVSLDTGYAEALIIFGDRTIKGVGGGVCQVSTTLFRTVFFGGYQVDERYSHAYRVTYYEQTASGGTNTDLAGLDATVYVPLVDFKFTNDSANWLLMETYVNQGARTLIWKFYSSNDGREVRWTTTGLKNTVDPPKPLYEENSELAKGEIKQVDWAVKGADVTVTRTVTRNGDVIHDDVFATHYQPWRSVYQYGPGTKLPKDG